MSNQPINQSMTRFCFVRRSKLQLSNVSAMSDKAEGGVIPVCLGRESGFEAFDFPTDRPTSS